MWSCAHWDDDDDYDHDEDLDDEEHIFDVGGDWHVDTEMGSSQEYTNCFKVNISRYSYIWYFDSVFDISQRTTHEFIRNFSKHYFLKHIK